MLRSVWRPRKNLILTALLFIVWEYWFAIAGFAFFRCVGVVALSRPRVTLPLTSCGCGGCVELAGSRMTLGASALPRLAKHSAPASSCACSRPSTRASRTMVAWVAT